jgi:hypothetical protein
MFITSHETQFSNTGLSEAQAKLFQDGAVELYYDGGKKLETTSAGIDVTGRVTADDLTVENTTGNLSAIFTSTNGMGTLEVGGSTGAFIDIKHPATDDYDLRLGVNGTNGYINVVNNFTLTTNGENSFYAAADGATELYFDGSKKLETTNTGVVISGGLDCSATGQVVAKFEGTGVSDPQIYLGDDMSSPVNNCIILGYDKADNRGYLCIAGDADNTLSISDGNLVGINTSTNVEHFNVQGNIRLINPTGTTRRINALPSGGYNLGTSGGSAIAFHRFSDAGGGSDEIAFETHHQGNRHAETARFLKSGGITFNGDTAAANALDDYEEGTWSANDGSGQSISITNNNTGKYTKIGRMVLCTFDVTYGTNSDGNSSRIVAPFTAGTGYGNGWVGWTELGRPMQIHVSGSAVYFMDNDNAGNAKHLTNAELSGKRFIGGFMLHT